MVAKSANPNCSARCRYCHEGKLFVVELKPEAPLLGWPIDRVCRQITQRNISGCALRVVLP